MNSPNGVISCVPERDHFLLHMWHQSHIIIHRDYSHNITYITMVTHTKQWNLSCYKKPRMPWSEVIRFPPMPCTVSIDCKRYVIIGINTV